MASKATPDVVVSHWSVLLENLQVSPLAFYTAVEAALSRRQIPATKNGRVDYKEAGLLSSSREYLHVSREKLVFDICGAPFGTGFFVSWWLAEDRLEFNAAIRLLIILGMLIIAGAIINTTGLVLGTLTVLTLVFVGLWIASVMAEDGAFDDEVVVAIPLIGTLYLKLFKPSTYYRIDSMLMFQKAVHNAVLEVVDGLTAEKGLRALGEADRKPIMREFYGSKAS